MLPRLLVLAAAGSSLVLGACHGAHTGGEPSRPTRTNVLLVTVSKLSEHAFDEALRAELVTPSLDALCARGVAFSNATALSAGTDAELATIFTGLHPRHHGTYASIYDLGVDARTPAELLCEVGYATGGFTVGTPTADQPGFQKGFDVFDAPTTDESWVDARPNADVLGAALDWLRAHEEAADGRPWFCWVHLNAPQAHGRELSNAQLRSLPPDTTPDRAQRLLDSRNLGSARHQSLVTSHALNGRLGLVALDEDLAELVAFVESHAVGGSRESAGGIITAMTALRGTGGTEPVLEPLRGFRVPLLFASTAWDEERTSDRAATLADVLPTLIGMLPGASMATRDSDTLLKGEPDPARLIVLDRIELGKPAETVVRLGDATVGITGIFEGFAFTGNDIMRDAPPEQVERARAAYAAWSGRGSEADHGRRFELERETLRQAGLWVSENAPELLPALDDR